MTTRPALVQAFAETNGIDPATIARDAEATYRLHSSIARHNALVRALGADENALSEPQRRSLWVLSHIDAPTVSALVSLIEGATS